MLLGSTMFKTMDLYAGASQSVLACAQRSRIAVMQVAQQALGT
ncbi:MAG: hypothetical protein V4631_20680 [Pseudomonadota bacterium]